MTVLAKNSRSVDMKEEKMKTEVTQLKKTIEKIVEKVGVDTKISNKILKKLDSTFNNYLNYVKEEVFGMDMGICDKYYIPFCNELASTIEKISKQGQIPTEIKTEYPEKLKEYFKVYIEDKEDNPEVVDLTLKMFTNSAMLEGKVYLLDEILNGTKKTLEEVLAPYKWAGENPDEFYVDIADLEKYEGELRAIEHDEYFARMKRVVAKIIYEFGVTDPDLNQEIVEAVFEDYWPIQTKYAVMIHDNDGDLDKDFEYPEDRIAKNPECKELFDDEKTDELRHNMLFFLYYYAMKKDDVGPGTKSDMISYYSDALTLEIEFLICKHVKASYHNSVERS